DLYDLPAKNPKRQRWPSYTSLYYATKSVGKARFSDLPNAVVCFHPTHGNTGRFAGHTSISEHPQSAKRHHQIALLHYFPLHIVLKKVLPCTTHPAILDADRLFYAKSSHLLYEDVCASAPVDDPVRS